MKGSQDSNSGRNLEAELAQRPWRRVPTGLFVMPPSVCLLIEPGTTWPGAGLATVGWASPIT